LPPSVSIISSPSAGPAAAATRLTCVNAGGGTVERKPREGDGMRLDRNHFSGYADVTGQHHGIGADIGADVDEHASCGSVRAQKIKLVEIVIGLNKAPRSVALA